VLEVRTLEPIAASASEYHSPFNLRDRLALALGATRPQVHDEIDQIFMYKGLEVNVKEKIRVESQDPNLMAAMAKMNALERSVALGRKALNIVMDKDD
jgi:hypothetical protein